MRKHITQAEILRIEKLLRSGVNKLDEIQAIVFVHSDCIKAVAKKYSNTQKRLKKEAADAKKAAKDAPKEEDSAVDPLS